MFRLPVIRSTGTAVLSAGLLGGACAAFSGQDEATALPVERARYLMGTVCRAVAYPPDEPGRFAAEAVADSLEAAFDEIARLEAVLSDWRDDSELSRLNRGAASAPFPCSRDLFDFIAAAIGYNRMTGGAFDTTVAPLVRLWDLRGEGRIPTSLEIGQALMAARSDHLVLDTSQRTVRFEVPGMGLDPGALGKGYALDAAAKVLKTRGIRSALLDFGGQVLAIGSPPGADSWAVAIAHPARRDEPVLMLKLREGSVATSGSSERRLIVEGRQLGHVLDPRTGVPLETRGSASVIAPTASDADAFSTAMLVMGPERGLEFVAGKPELSAVFLDVDDSGELLVRANPGVEMSRLPAAVCGEMPRIGAR